MSFILDSLRKSENKRRRKGVSVPPSIHEPVAGKAGGRRSWTLWILVFLVINAALLAWLAGAWWLAPEARRAYVRQQGVDAGLAGRDEVRPPAPPADEVRENRATRENLPATADQRVGRRERDKVVAAVAPDPRKIYRYRQLPPEIRQQIPDLKMSLHAYNRADGQASMVRLNDRIYREGQLVAQELILESITAEGVVLQFSGYRFLLARKGG
jgi:hypothetical protein